MELLMFLAAGDPLPGGFEWDGLFDPVADLALQGVTSVIPVALSVMAIIFGVRIAIRTFRGVAR